MHQTLAKVALTISVVAMAASRADGAALTYVSYLDSTLPITSDSFNSGTTSSSSQTIDRQNLDLRADFGDLGIRIAARESAATVAWRDEWTITGVGGTIEVQWALDGFLNLSGPVFDPTCAECDPATVALASLFGSTSISAASAVIQTVSQTSTGSQNVNTSGTFFFSYTSGQTFGAGFRLSGVLGDDSYGGLIDFLNSASVTAVVLPAGASLTTSSGADYNVRTQQVPEPATLFLLGPAVLAVVRRRIKVHPVR